jgi:uncharacterized protein YjiS (DUF1127 family)
MLITTFIATARAGRIHHFARLVQAAGKRFVRGVRILRERLAQARRDRREIEMLLRADDRLLADIGLTRADVHFAFGSGRKRSRWIAARDRDETRAISNREIEKLPRIDAPSLAPALPGQTVGHENFR